MIERLTPEEIHVLASGAYRHEFTDHLLHERRNATALLVGHYVDMMEGAPDTLDGLAVFAALPPKGREGLHEDPRQPGVLGCS